MQLSQFMVPDFLQVFVFGIGSPRPYFDQNGHALRGHSDNKSGLSKSRLGALQIGIFELVTLEEALTPAGSMSFCQFPPQFCGTTYRRNCRLVKASKMTECFVD